VQKEVKKLTFSDHLLAWFNQHGRHGLPWQHPRSPYFVWLSEIMLQQTQVTSVVGYFQRFTQRLPDLASLANASADEVLSLWAGLGYYSRARNLHACAKLCVARHGGELPNDLDALIALPGIGRSTAAAILSQAFNHPAAILDGNVKRVLARQLNIQSELGHAQTQLLWQEAESRLSSARAADYTQAIMDLGATVCTPKNPACGACPVQIFCRAFEKGSAASIPVKKPKKASPKRYTHWLIARSDEGEVLMQRRPGSGIWGGLYTLPEADSPADFESLPLPLKNLEIAQALDEIKHVFTHFQLYATPHTAAACKTMGLAMNDANAEYLWVAADDIAKLGMPAPVKKLLARISGS
jgi:A/G-specific adenine glycosylase